MMLNIHKTDTHEAMPADVKKDILSVLIDALNSIRRQEYAQVKELSNHTIHNASIYQDSDSISFAVITYALSKLLERDKGQLRLKIISLLENAVSLLEESRIQEYRAATKEIMNTISKADSRLKIYIEEVINKAGIKKASSMYSHGISMSRAAELLGISYWELMNYVGKTTIHDAFPERIDPKKRIRLACELFKT